MKKLIAGFSITFFFVASMVFLSTSLVMAQNVTDTLPKHWHESGGFGTSTSGGLGGTVYKVTNLNNSGPGSFRDAVSGDNRLVVFEVGGVIDLNNSDIELGSNITIAGQTAPSPGITLIRANLSANGDHTVVSHITMMLGDNTTGEKDVANIRGNYVVFDHVTTAWSIDENLSIHGVDNVTLYKCIIAEGLQYAGHVDGEHSKGSLINGSPTNLSLIGCLYAHNAMRNPRCDRGEIFIANQVNYNWTTGWDEPDPQWFNYVVCTYFADVTFVGNVALQGPESIGEIYLDGYNSASNIPSLSNAYINDNIILDQEGNDLQIYDPDEHVLLDTPPLWPGGFEAMPAHESLYENLRTVGSRPGNRDVHNSRIVLTVANGDGEVIDSQDEVGGYPDYAGTSHSLVVPDGTEARQEWLDSLEDEIAVDTFVDLSRLYTMVGSQASDKFRSYSGGISSTLHGNYSSRVSSDGIVAYPNPVSSQLQVALGYEFSESPIIQLFDYTGRMVLSIKSAGIENSINMGSLPPGLYIIKVSSGMKCIVQSIVKK